MKRKRKSRNKPLRLSKAQARHFQGVDVRGIGARIHNGYIYRTDGRIIIRAMVGTVEPGKLSEGNDSHSASMLELAKKLFPCESSYVVDTKQLKKALAPMSMISTQKFDGVTLSLNGKFTISAKGRDGEMGELEIQAKARGEETDVSAMFDPKYLKSILSTHKTMEVGPSTGEVCGTAPWRFRSGVTDTVLLPIVVK